MALISNPPTNKSIFQFPPNFPNGQVSDAWTAWFQEVQANNYVFPAAQTGFALGWDAGGNLVNVPNTGADQTAAWTAADNAIRSDLAATTGAGLVGYLAPYTGAQARTQSKKNSDMLSAFDFMTTAEIADVQSGAMTLDVTAPLQAAITACGNLGRILWLPQGYYLVTDAAAVGGYCLKVTRPITIIGEGFYSAIVPKSTVGSTADTLVIEPSPLYFGKSLLQNFTIGNPNTGSRYGNGGVALVTNVAGSNAPKFTMRDMAIYQGSYASGGHAFRHVNTPANNVNGGMYGACIENCILQGGVRLESSGDSNVFQKNIVSGTNIGFYWSLIAGASCLNIEYNNITATGGAFKGDLGPRTVIRHNNIEMASGAGSNGAIADFNGANGVSYQCVFESNHIAAFGTSTVTACVRVKNMNGMDIGKNTFLSGAASLVTAINIVDGSAQNVRVHPNTYNGAFTVAAYNAGTTYAVGDYVSKIGYNWISLQAGNIGHTPETSPTWWQLTSGPKILDAGQGTCGVIKPLPALQNSWVYYGSSRSFPLMYKDCNGVVHLQGAISTGTATAGTTLLSLPVGFRPKLLLPFTVYNVGGVTNGLGNVFVYGTGAGAGEVTIQNGGNTLLSLDGISFLADGLADGVSAE